MSRGLSLFLAVLLVLVVAQRSHASTSPVALSHTLTASTERGGATTFLVHVENRGTEPVSNLTLSLVPRPPLVNTAAKLSVGNLAARQAVDLPLKVATVARIDQGELSSRSLFFVVKYLDAKGRSVELPALSRVPRQAPPATAAAAKITAPSFAAAAAQPGPGEYLLQWGARFHFLLPNAIAVDAAGNVYVADGDYHRVQKFDSSGNTLASWGGVFDPQGIAVDGSGNVYVSDWVTSTVSKFDSNGNILATWGSEGSGDGQFLGPRGVALDSSGNVYVADQGNRRIEKFDGNGVLLAIWNQLGSVNGEPFHPLGLAVARTGEVYATDPGHAAVHKFDSGGNLVTAWSLSGSGYFAPTGLAVDAAGNVYVTTSGAIQLFDSNGKFLSSFGSYGSAYGQFSYPWGVALDGNGNIYVADTYNQRVQKFSVSGNFLEAWASYGSEPGMFVFPQGLALDGAGSVYVADTGNNRIQKFDSSGKFVATWGSEGTGNGQFNHPTGVAVDASGNVYVTDPSNRRIQQFDSNGNFIKAWGYSEWLYNGPGAIAVDAQANLYLGDTELQYLEKFDNSGNLLFRTRGCYSTPPQDEIGFYPQGVALDRGGNIYVTDAATYGLQKLDSSGRCVAPWYRYFQNPVGIAVDGSINVYAVDNGWSNVVVEDTEGNLRGGFGSYGSENGQLNSPTGVAVDKLGSRVYVADSGNNRIEAFTGFGTTHFAVSAPSTATAGTPFTFTVTALDATNQTVAGFTGTVHFSSSDGSAVLPANSILTNGTGTFTATLKTVGSQTITASATSTPSVTGTSDPIAVSASTLVPDLTIAKRHSGSFQGGHRASYRITVKNSGKAATTGTVTVTDTLPAGLAPTGISGKGWTCTTVPLSCTTSRSLAPGKSYPAITITVTVADDAPSSVTNTATVSGGGEVNTSNDTAVDTAKVKHKARAR